MKKTGIKIGNKLYELRMEKNYTQEHLADKLDVSEKTYWNMENDKSSISLDVLHKIAEVYGIDMIELLKDDRVIVQSNSSKDNSTVGIIYNHMSEKLLEQYEERIKDLKEQINDLKEQIALLKSSQDRR